MPPRASSSTTIDDTLAHALLTAQTIAETYILPTLPEPLAKLASQSLSLALTAQPYISTIISSSIGLVQSLLSSNGGSVQASALISTGVLILTMYVALKIMNYVRRTIVGWVVLGVKMVLVLVAVQMAMYINAYGFEKFVRDVSWWGGMAWSFVEEILDGSGQQQPRGTRARGAKKNAGMYGQGPVGGAEGRTRWT